jgi:hypothetical protein
LNIYEGFFKLTKRGDIMRKIIGNEKGTKDYKNNWRD